MSTERRIHSSRARGERGAALVEYAFVSVILLAIVAGATDYGLGWRSGLSINEAVRTGARVGSGQAASIAADHSTLSGVKASLKASETLDGVELVVIYRSTTAGGTVPASCINAGSPTGPCNVLNGDQIRALDRDSFDIIWDPDPEEPPTGGTGCLRSTAALHAGWCPTGRSNLQATADYYGVYIRYRHDFLFPVLGEGRDVSRSAVMRLEPPSQ